MTKAERDAMRKRCEAATPGPWSYEGVSDKSNDYRVGVVCPVDVGGNVGAQIAGNVKDHPHYWNDKDEFGEWYCEEIAALDEESHTSDGGCGSDAAFIAHSRADLPTCLDHIDKLEGLLSELREYFDQRADADHNAVVFVPNEEMKLLSRIDALIGDGK